MAIKPESAPAAGRCVVCREDIRPGAKVCNHCKSAQDWTRYLARWSTVAAAVVGIGSLASAAYSLWKLVPSPAKIEAIAVSCQRNSVSLALVNVGGRPGVVRSVGLQIKSDGGSMPPIDLSPERIDENPIVESGKTATISYIHRVSGVATPKFELPSGAQCHYVVSVSGDDFSRATVPSTAQCECPRH